MEQAFRDLLERARQVMQNSYSPYSRFRVGAALLGQSGQVHVGTNVENGSYGLSICAERAAICAAVAAGERRFRAVAICTDTEEPTPPCGACRQVLLEFPPDMAVLLAGRGPEIEEYRLADLMARPFADFQPPAEHPVAAPDESDQP